MSEIKFRKGMNPSLLFSEDGRYRIKRKTYGGKACGHFQVSRFYWVLSKESPVVENEFTLVGKFDSSKEAREAAITMEQNG